MKMTDKVKATALSAAINSALAFLGDDLETNSIKLLDLIEKFVSPDWFGPARSMIRKSIESKDNWYRLMERMWNLDKNVRNTLLRNLSMPNGTKTSKARYSPFPKTRASILW